ncbi:MAG: heme o synthase [Gammaproteobacteria bacterium]
MEQTSTSGTLLRSIDDYLQLCKPKIVAMMGLTAVVGMYLALPGGFQAAAFDWAWPLSLIGIILCASCAAVLNHLLEAERDALMKRTRSRPVATGRITTVQASIWALSLGLSGTLLLLIYANVLTAVLTLTALVGYAAVYTLWLKPATPYNIVIGGLPGALPPLLGWTAITGQLDAPALLLAALIFVWTPAHFWALALNRIEEYRKSDYPMLPVTHGESYTRLQILLYSLLTLSISLLLYSTTTTGLFYLISAVILSWTFVVMCFSLLVNPTKEQALAVFNYSNLYLLLIFSALILDRGIAGQGVWPHPEQESFLLESIFPDSEPVSSPVQR